MYRETDAIIIESFEVLPRNVAVFQGVGRLRRVFPDNAASIPFSQFADLAWQKVIARTVAKLSVQEVAETKQRVKKAGNKHIEERDTNNPQMITEFLMTVFGACGEFKSVPTIEKKTREEVLWQQAKSPWRRSPIWLVFRVALQRLCRIKNQEDQLYKSFMAFFMSKILKMACTQNLPSDTIHCMAAKLSCRIQKLGTLLVGSEESIARCCVTLETAVKLLDDRWASIRSQEAEEATQNVITLSGLDFAIAVPMTLPALDGFIADLSRRTSRTRTTGFDPQEWAIQTFATEVPTLPSSFGSTSESLPFVLVAFEEWVAKDLGRWLEGRLFMEDTTSILCNLTKTYTELAFKLYDANPESLSVMFLTVTELWVACDQSACAHTPLLCKYMPEVPDDLLQSLLLPLLSQMERLAKVEEYIKSRVRLAKPRAPSVFRSYGDASGFQVRYVEQSVEHQSLLQTIMKDAEASRDRKIAEFRSLKATYTDLMDQYDRANHQYREVWDAYTDEWTTEHVSNCHKCFLDKSAARLCIHIHEWPLPSDLPAAQCVVFELKVPIVFAFWRETTFYLMSNVLGMKYIGKDSANEKVYTVDSCLLKYNTSVQMRLHLSSDTKPNAVTHRDAKRIATATEEEILLNNGLRYSYYDQAKHCFAQSLVTTDKLVQLCAYSQECAIIQDFFLRPSSRPSGRSANKVISAQAFCPSDMTLDEFKALTTIPTGHRIQWLNIFSSYLFHR